MRDTKEWTLMFYMASDNPLAVSIVSQLKALKAAGFHHEVNVIAQFDPFTEGTPTHIFEVNMINKLKQPFSPNIGFAGTDSFVRNLIEDKLWRDEKCEDGALVREALQDVIKDKHKVPCILPRAPELNGTSKRVPGKRRHEPDPSKSLRTFLDFCSQKYPARRYMLFMLGHGVVVGNDVFMFDEHAENQSITLSEMGEALTEFKDKIQEQGATFELVSFHSCSVSSLEVAYELQGTAKYMLASQAPAFVGSWPYRQILIRIFNDLERNGNRKNVKELLLDIFYYCLHNAADYLLAGYSHQVTLCDLERVAELEVPMQKLSAALVKALSSDEAKKSDAASKYVILYAHWKAQSFFKDMYTDLYDFCHCIVDRCERIEDTKTPLSQELQDIKDACDAVMKKLAKPDLQNVKNNGEPRPEPTVVVACEYAGPAYQYSQGLSVYFPWSQPSEDSQILEQYETYKFHTKYHPELNGDSKKKSDEPMHSWLDFLKEYFKETQRFTKRDELEDQHQRRLRIGENKRRLSREQNQGLDPAPEQKLQKEIEEAINNPVMKLSREQKLQEEIGSLIYSGEGPLGGVALKDYPSEKTGEDCNCQSFKNYPRDIRARGQRRKKARAMSISDTLLGEF